MNKTCNLSRSTSTPRRASFFLRLCEYTSLIPHFQPKLQVPWPPPSGPQRGRVPLISCNCFKIACFWSADAPHISRGNLEESPNVRLTNVPDPSFCWRKCKVNLFTSLPLKKARSSIGAPVVSQAQDLWFTPSSTDAAPRDVPPP